MKLLSVDITNFMAIGKANIALADRGLVLIQGINEDETSADSNGAGKSSFADALCWCLYGVTARGEEGDRVVNRFVGNNCGVSVGIEDGTDLYRITRYRKHKTHKNILRVLRIDTAAAAAGKKLAADLTKGTEKLTQELVNQIIGCSYEVFTGAVYAGQERMPDLPGMTDKALKMLIEEASGATLLEAAYAEAQTRLRTKKAEVDLEAGLVERAKDSLNVAFNNLTDFDKGKLEFEIARTEAIKVIHAKALLVKNEAKTLIDKMATGDKSLDLRVQIGVLDKSITAVESERLLEKNFQSDLTAAQTTLARADADINNLAANAKQDVLSLAKVEHKIGCPCGECARPYTAAEIAPAKEIAKNRVQHSKQALERATAARGALSADVVTLTDALEKYCASMTDISAANLARGSLQAKLETVIKDERALESLKTSIKVAVDQITAKKAETNPFIRRIADAQKVLTLNESALKGHQSDLELAIAELKVAETVVKVFSPAGVRAFLLDEVTPFLNDQTAKYLGTLSDGNITATWTTLIKSAKGELREKFSIEVMNAKGAETFKGSSGGEKRKVRIACALALQDLVARRATKPIELFIGDEIDDALDPAGIERLTTILEEKARERGSVFIISHSDLKDWIRNTITVTKKDEMATFEESAA